MNKNKNSKDTLTNQIKKILAEYLGVDEEDIKEEDLLTEDLHMNATELSDLLQILYDKGVITKDIDLTEIETVEELIEVISSQEFIH
ncbi:hypothetical protein A2686_02490 [Candidatus Woesebacteria bacterium RIFCSPHIGHO2_01_FULL_38_10]|uniref:Carrier domain-containing protein n=1 Tax=Candidatus Woesebacteria bacterium RIFCSPLOWO2_01_FULL_39_10b TaxID=1802517 RepID=A0A1F8B8Q9_9BACT|nr:MAG: hypothetical protein A2686_02490 [Candidatus Woesebacteria bacterium RIFCSPHIGHO2_01_FULL_38_10]OGM60436.1 MAG: hypothetical protein A2892_00180 [Candidatus Woesebacteria bacterium RIFCSPLOWO2_01_FULL_39_10b]